MVEFRRNFSELYIEAMYTFKKNISMYLINTLLFDDLLKICQEIANPVQTIKLFNYECFYELNIFKTRKHT